MSPFSRHWIRKSFPELRILAQMSFRKASGLPTAKINAIEMDMKLNGQFEKLFFVSKICVCLSWPMRIEMLFRFLKFAMLDHLQELIFYRGVFHAANRKSDDDSIARTNRAD